eukprot:scaffold35980_cov16-Tisochrysis_lutea.AAC.2
MRTPPSCDPSLAGLSSGGPLENGEEPSQHKEAFLCQAQFVKFLHHTRTHTRTYTHTVIVSRKFLPSFLVVHAIMTMRGGWGDLHINVFAHMCTGVLDPQTAELAVVTTTLVEGPPLAGATVTLQVPGPLHFCSKFLGLRLLAQFRSWRECQLFPTSCLLSPAGATAVEVGSANARASVALLLSVRRARKTADAHAGRLQAEALLFPDSNRASVAQDPPLLAQSSKP